MKTLRTIVPLAVLTLATGCCHRDAAAAGGARGGASEEKPLPTTGRVVPGEYVFTVAPGTTPSSLQASLSDLAPRRVQALGNDTFLVAFEGNDPGLSRLSFRIGNGQILAVQPNFVYRAQPR